MKKILLACNAGMSTSILVKKMKDSAFEEDIEVEINELKAALSVPVFVIDQELYGKAHGEKVLQFALENCK